MFDHLKTRFPLGQVVITANARDVLTADELNAAMARHSKGDWGNVCREDGHANNYALRQGGRLFSVYGNADRRFWIITEADRSATTILLPQDY